MYHKNCKFLLNLKVGLSRNSPPLLLNNTQKLNVPAMGTMVNIFTCNWLSDFVFDTLKVSCATLLISIAMLFGYSPIHNSQTYWNGNFTCEKYIIA